MTRAETQTRIVDAAFRTLVEEGYHETTMKDIAGRAGLATGLAHYYFESKDDLLLAALELGCPLNDIQLEGLPGLEQAKVGFAAEREGQIWNLDAYKLIFDMVGAGMHNPRIAE
ncbi:MAG: TetR family transcriptional regulator, partial [Chloroflexi bacterium]